MIQAPRASTPCILHAASATRRRSGSLVHALLCIRVVGSTGWWKGGRKESDVGWLWWRRWRSCGVMTLLGCGSGGSEGWVWEGEGGGKVGRGLGGRCGVGGGVAGLASDRSIHDPDHHPRSGALSMECVWREVP